ncbi:MAG: restriction endonuclease subunit S [Bilifractor sp.]
MNKRKTPAIRFKGYQNDWEQHKVGELTNVLSASRVHKEEWAEDGIPFFRSSDVVSAFKGTENKKAFISIELYEQLAKSSGKLEKNDILITGGGSIGIPYIVPDNKPLYSKDADLIWIKHSANFDSRYLYTYFISEEFREYLASISHMGTIPHYTIEQVKDTPVRLPSIDEQRELGDFFVSLDHLITLHQRKLEKLKILKKTMLENCFPQKGESVPRVRFGSFTGDWEQRKFSELYEKASRKNDLTYGKYDIISVANMYFKPDSYITDERYLLTYNIFELGDIAFEGNKSKNYAHGRFVENTIGNGIVSHVFDVFKPIMKPYDLQFWKYAINNERLMGGILLRSTKASTMMTNLVANDFLQETFVVPSYPEQQKIGAFFQGLDNLITLHQCKMEKLQTIKKSLLRSMFV